MSSSQSPTTSTLCLARPRGGWAAEPLQVLTLTGARGSTITIADGGGCEYFRAPATPEVRFAVGGRLGTHVIRALDAGGKEIDRLAFDVAAASKVQDADGHFCELFDILNKTMRCYTPSGVGSLMWRGRTYHNFVSWILDHVHTAKGMQYFSPHTGGWVEIMRDAQKDDGMVWSFVRRDPGPGYYDSAYGPYGYAKRVDGALFARQPVENHNEYNYVECMHLAWKGSGDDEWLKETIDSGVRALEYTVNSPVRWSEKFGLLKRGYTIDSWDFQVHDEYTVEFPLATAQNIDPQRTKFGVFHGDNHGYARACECLAEMLEHLGRNDEAQTYRRRAQEIHRRLSEIAWNGRFFTHRVEEDPTVKRDLGVDEKSQIAMSNAYALNRGIGHEQATAILETYLDLKNNLPNRSPGEWYSIFPPFGRGFGKDSTRWQYMNAGVHGHAAGELARGAFEHGYEQYGADILLRLRELGKKHGGTIKFAYTGAYEEPPPPQVFSPIDLSEQANMDLWDHETGKGRGWMSCDAGNDLRGLPTGRQRFAGVPFVVADPRANDRRAAIAVAHRETYPQSVSLPVNAKGGAIYLLHTVNGLGPSRLAGAVMLKYDDGTEHTTYLQAGKHLTGWWFPDLKAQDAGVAWRGPNPRSNDVGVCWAAISNPQPEKTIASIEFSAMCEGAIYAVLGLTLADRMPYHEPDPVSHGGPDNWSGGLCMAALMEGLVGVRNAGVALDRVRLSPRWPAAGVEQVEVVAHLPASNGYVAYQYRHDPNSKVITLKLAGSGRHVDLRVLLPEGATKVTEATIAGRPVAAVIEQIESSRYAALPVELDGPQEVIVCYA